MQNNSETLAVIYCHCAAGSAASLNANLTYQEALCRAFANRKGYEVVEIFRDSGAQSTPDKRGGWKALLPFLDVLEAFRESRAKAASDDRTGLKALIAFLEVQERPHVVIAEDISRLGRDLLQNTKARQAIAVTGGTVEFAILDLPDTPEGQLVQNVLLAAHDFLAAENEAADRLRNATKASRIVPVAK